MRRYILLPFLAVAFAAQAQDTYINERITNSSSDVIGTARYVGMGGALGALGADMSVISWNPAGIGIYRRSDIAMTFGGTWGKSYINEENRGKATFDQAGFVYHMPLNSTTCPHINLAFNYQKKINFNHNFYASNGALGGLSQMDQLAELARFYETEGFNLPGLALDNGFFDPVIDEDGNQIKDERGRGYYCNDYPSSSNIYTHHSEGSLQSFDFNLSTSINDRVFLGLTLGIDNMRYRGWNVYGENSIDKYTQNEIANYDLNNDVNISGTGVNVKLGAIFFPIPDNSLRFGFAVETPTWYRLQNSTLFSIYNYFRETSTEEWESYLKFKLRSPWKLRASIGSTVGSNFAWDVDYEFATYASTSMGYPKYEDVSYGNMKDVAMNQLTRDNLRGTHTLRAGFEINATKELAFRLGYNLSTSAYKKHVGFDQYELNSAAMDYATGTSYMRLGTTNLLTLGVGYRTKSFYIDLAYKLRNQKGDFYAFDTSFAQTASNSQFVAMNSDFANQTIAPAKFDLTRHAITCTLGFKFK